MTEKNIIVTDIQVLHPGTRKPAKPAKKATNKETTVDPIRPIPIVLGNV